jgi:3-deoxy-manno-octulosonate cytidylyltransferase (CMP-KDO synthetase)
MGRPLVEHVYLRALEAKTVDRVVVATDDRRILEAVQKFGGDCVMTDPGHRSGSDRLGEVAGNLDADIIVNVQGDEPLIAPAVIDAVVQVHMGEQPPDIATVAVPLDAEHDYLDRNVVKVVTGSDGYALYFSRSAIPYGWQSDSGEALRHIGIYAYGRAALLDFVSLPAGKLEKMEDLEQLRALENGMSILVVKVDEFNGIGVDTPEDLLKVEDMMKKTKVEVEDSAPGAAEGGA